MRIILVIILCLISVSVSAEAATYYVCGSAASCNSGNGSPSGWSTGASGNTGLSKSVPKQTVAQGLAAMGASDTLVIGNGTYTNQPITTAPSGATGAYTIVKAENVGGAIIDMSASGDWETTGISTDSADHHIQFEGFKIKSSLTAYSNGAVFSSGDYIKFLRIATYNAHQTGNTSAFVIGTGSDHVLVEECWAWGTARYKFIAYQTTNVIFRRCVARHDYNTDVPGGEGLTQQATFVNYDSTNTLFQNCIAIDSGVDGSGQELYGGFWDENNDNVNKSGKITGSIVLNFRTNHAGMADKVSGTRSITNSVIWDSGGGWAAIDRGAASYSPTITLNQNTIGVLPYEMTNVYESYGAAVSSNGSWNTTTTNSILYDAHSNGVNNYMVSNYNVLWANDDNYGGPSHTPTPGANDITSHNPIYNASTNPNGGLKYLPRIEAGSYMRTAGSGGGRIGAEILYKHGTSGTIYGEAGYDTLTIEPLWPFPNEALIKADFASYSGPGPAGARGFAATGTGLYGGAITLTSYIWEYLGNAINPANIYGAGSSGSAQLGSGGATIGSGGGRFN